MANSKHNIFDELPEEVRLYIFRLATLKISQAEDIGVDYSSLEAVALKERDWSDSAQRALTVKLTIVLVSKEWKRIATEMLYECIRIEHGTESLVGALEKKADPSLEFDHGQWVRRIEISPHIKDFDPFNPLILCRILECCPAVETIVRSAALSSCGVKLLAPRLPPNSSFPSLTSVKRIDWWIPGRTTRRLQIDASPNHISGFLKDLLLHSPNLRYLTLSGFHYHQWDSHQDAPLSLSHPLPLLTTLRIECHGNLRGPQGPESAISLNLPNVTHFIHGGKFPITQAFAKTFGPQIRVLELINVDREPEILDWIELTKVLNICVNLEELSLQRSMTPYRDTAYGSRVLSVKMKSLERLRINLDTSGNLGCPSLSKWVLSELVAPKLERVTLHGGKRADWVQLDCYPLLLQWASRDEKNRVLEVVEW